VTHTARSSATEGKRSVLRNIARKASPTAARVKLTFTGAELSASRSGRSEPRVPSPRQARVCAGVARPATSAVVAATPLTVSPTPRCTPNAATKGISAA